MQEKMKVSDTCDLEQTVLFRWISAKMAIVSVGNITSCYRALEISLNVNCLGIVV